MGGFKGGNTMFKDSLLKYEYFTKRRAVQEYRQPCNTQPVLLKLLSFLRKQRYPNPLSDVHDSSSLARLLLPRKTAGRVLHGCAKPH